MAFTVGTDASLEGWGGHAVRDSKHVALFGDQWSVAETKLHINVLELRAIRLTLQLLVHLIRGLHILVEWRRQHRTTSYINKQ